MRLPTTKRLFDFTVATVALVATVPIQAIVGVVIRKRLGTPILFRQIRPGLHGKPFELIKFRTMLAIEPQRGRVDDASRMTDLGRRLRATSLDELPTLWNVIRGDMSLVGPRPLLTQYLERYSVIQGRRHEVRPGLTGLAQISGRNLLTWDEKFNLDVEYVDTQCFRLDAKILFTTISCVLRRKGIAAPDHATMTEFLGSDATEHQPV